MTEELERLVSLRDRGDLSQAEFEKAKAKLLGDEPIAPKEDTGDSKSSNERKSFPGIGLALGVFVGNLLGALILGGDLARGFAVGSIAAVLVMIVALIRRASQER